MKKLIISANRGNLRVLRHLEADDDPLSQEHLLEVLGESGKEHVSSIQDTVTDQAGRFARGAAPGMETGMSYGEEHHLKREIEHAAIEHMAQRIEYTLAAEAFPPWILAAPSEIAKDILAALSSAATAKLLGQQTADLTRVPLSDLEARFLSKP